MTQENWIIIMTIISTIFLFLCGLITGGHELGSIYYCIGRRVVETNIWLLTLLSFPILVDILPLKSPCTITIISRGAPLVLLFFRVMMYVAKYLVSETTGFLVTHYGISFADLLGGFPLEPFPFDLKSFWICPLLPHLWKVMSDLADDPLPEPLPFPMRRLLKSTRFKDLLIYC